VTARRIIPALLFLAFASAAYADQPKYLEVTLLSTNDLHSKLWNHDIPDPVKKTIAGRTSAGGKARDDHKEDQGRGPRAGLPDGQRRHYLRLVLSWQGVPRQAGYRHDERHRYDAMVPGITSSSGIPMS